MQSAYRSTITPVARTLKNKYKDFRHNNKRNSLNELLFILCSVKRSQKVYERAYRSIKSNYPTFRSLSKATTQDFEKKINWGGLQKQKSRSLTLLIGSVTQRFGKLTLAPLRRMSEADCERFLCSLPGVGKKVARCVMLYSLDMQVFPVDAHCWRIANRLGWIKKKAEQKTCSPKAMDELQTRIPPRLRLSLHVNMVSLGREICTALLPKCSICPIEDHCPKVSASGC